MPSTDQATVDAAVERIAVAVAVPVDCSQRVADYFAVLDAGLAERYPVLAARKKFLTGRRDHWIAQYEKFQGDVDAGRPTPVSVTAWDYINIIAGLDQRIARIAGAS